MSWKTFFQIKRNIIEFTATIVVLIGLMLSFSQFLQIIELRDGVTLPDPFIKTFNPIDLTWLTFTLIYLSIIIYIVSIRREPNKIMHTLQVYGLMVIFRVISMFLTPFNAPETLILLDDPFVQLFGKGNILTKDLFFSGHTATLFLLFLLTENNNLRFIFLFSTIAVGTAVLLQHVHYSIDVFIAPFIAYGAYRIVNIIHKKNSELNVERL